MKILIIGSGGRENVLAWKIKQSSKYAKLFVAPGNAGTAEICQNIDLDIKDFAKIKDILIEFSIEMIIIGPEAPLVGGLHDYLISIEELRHIIIVGPKKEAAKLEGSKKFAKEFMLKNNIPTAKYQSFTKENIEQGYNYIDNNPSPYVLKADGLASGKGVLIIDNKNEAKRELKEMLLNSKFGEASKMVVIEEFLSGTELSCFIFTDGKGYVTLPFAKDYKKIGENDKGLNTGGMGAVSPVPFVSKDFERKIHERIIKPTMKGIIYGNLEYKGFIFIGLIKVGENPYVIEYNVRMGDPEAEVVIPRIKNDLVELFSTIKNNSLGNIELEIDKRSVATIMAVSGGYPENYKKGYKISGLNRRSESIFFHAGTKIDSDGEVITAGGRVIAVSSYGNNHKEAIKKSYKAIDKIKFKNINYRKDIGFDL